MSFDANRADLTIGVLGSGAMGRGIVQVAAAGGIEAVVDGTELKADISDTLSVPTHARVTLRNASAKTAAFLFQVDDAPLQRKLGFFEQFE